MNVINSVLKLVPRTADGFEDIEQFWNATEKLTFPLEHRLKASLFNTKTVTPKSTPQKVDSDAEFNYETSSSISDDGEDDDDEEESQSDSDIDDNDDDVSSPGELSTKTGKSQSILTSGVKSSRSSIESSVYSPLNASLGTIGLSPLGTTMTNGSIRQSLESGVDGSDISGRDSILSRGTPSTAGNSSSTRTSIIPGSSGKKSNANTSAASRRSVSGLDISAPGDLNDSSFFADRSDDMNETGVQSEFGFGQRPPTSVDKGRRGSISKDTLATPASAAKSKLATPRGTDASINLTSAAKGGRAVDRSGLRVSFGGDQELDDLSPIAGSVAGSVDTGVSKRSQSRNTSKNSTNNTSINTSLNLSPSSPASTSINDSVDVSRNTTKNTTMNSSHNTSHNTSAASELQSREGDSERRDNDSFGDDYVEDYEQPDDPPDEQSQDELEDSVSRIASQTDTPTTNRSFSRSGLNVSNSELHTPHSGVNASMRSSGSRMSASMMSTPGSREFPYGYRYPEDPDATAMHELSTDEDDDLDTTGVSTPGQGRKNGRSRKHSTVTDGEEELDVSAEAVSVSFIDRDFLDTISSGNKKYQKGREVLKKHKPPARKHNKLYDSSEEENEEEQHSSEAGSDHDAGPRRRSKRATKGQRFEYWKGERPIYEEGIVVGINPVDPTPQKRKRVVKVTEDGKTKRAKKTARTEESDQEDEPRVLPVVKVPKNVRYLQREECESLEIWDDVLETETNEKIFCPAESLQPPVALPRTAKRLPGRDKVGYAAHSFNVPEIPEKMSGWISGFIDLPPDAIKDAEGVGRYTQVFFVSDCQDGALELGLADPAKNEWIDRSAQRVLLKKGDCFYVPPGNIYRLENHSTAKASKLHWVIIKPLEPRKEDDEGEDGSVRSEFSVGDSPNTTGALVDGRGVGRRVPVDVEEDM